MISKRAQNIDTSGIRKVFAMASSLEDPVDLSIGQPDFEAFQQLKENTKSAIDQGANRYTPTQGIPELRSKISTEQDLGIDFDVCITSGVTGGLTLCYLTLLDVGDEILIPDPYFVVYKELATLLGVKIAYYDTYPTFCTTAESIAAAITPKTKAVIVNSPSNPTGVTISQEELDKISALAQDRGIYLIYDEIYDAFCFDRSHACLGVSAPRRKTDIVVNGYSKTYGVPGWRLGYLLASKELIERMSTVQQYTFVCANSAAQQALSQMPDIDFGSLRQSYMQRRDYICEELSEYYDFVRPGGAFYLFPRAPKDDGLEFVKKCIAKELLVVPGNAFSRRNSHFRISFSASMSQLERGVKILKDLAQ